MSLRPGRRVGVSRCRICREPMPLRFIRGRRPLEHAACKLAEMEQREAIRLRNRMACPHCARSHATAREAEMCLARSEEAAEHVRLWLARKDRVGTHDA